MRFHRMKIRKRATVDELQDAILYLEGIFNEDVTKDANRLFGPLGCPVLDRFILKIVEAVKYMSYDIQLELENRAATGAILRDECWKYVHPSVRPEEFQAERGE